MRCDNIACGVTLMPRDSRRCFFHMKQAHVTLLEHVFNPSEQPLLLADVRSTLDLRLAPSGDRKFIPVLKSPPSPPSAAPPARWPRFPRPTPTARHWRSNRPSQLTRRDVPTRTPSCVTCCEILQFPVYIIAILIKVGWFQR